MARVEWCVVAHTLPQRELVHTLKFYKIAHKGTGGPVTLNEMDGSIWGSEKASDLLLTMENVHVICHCGNLSLYFLTRLLSLSRQVHKAVAGCNLSQWRMPWKNKVWMVHIDLSQVCVDVCTCVFSFANLFFSCNEKHFIKSLWYKRKVDMELISLSSFNIKSLNCVSSYNLCLLADCF